MCFVNFVFINSFRPSYASHKNTIYVKNSPNMSQTARSLVITATPSSAHYKHCAGNLLHTFFPDFDNATTSRCASYKRRAERLTIRFSEFSACHSFSPFVLCRSEISASAASVTLFV